MTKPRIVCLFLLGLLPASSAFSVEIPAGVNGFKSTIAPFFETYCINCHGPKKSKGKVTLHTLQGDLSADDNLPRWEKILDALKSGEMPPEDKEQPPSAQRLAVAQWIEAGLRANVATTKHEAEEPTTRRLTNFEYENTLRDLLGFSLHIIDRLPEDPVKPYHFNNTAEFMRLGPEQIDLYLEIARYAMASAIVDPDKPEVFKTERSWDASGSGTGQGLDEVGVEGNRRNSAAGGMRLKGFPTHGEFRVTFSASAILPTGYTEVPLRLVMGYPLDRNSGSLQVRPIGTVRLTNNPDQPQKFEFRGRIENFPVEKERTVKGNVQPDVLHITPQNLFDDGTLNDNISISRNLALPRVVLHNLAFEAPLTDTWPPPSHTKILFDSPLRESDPQAYMREVLQRFMSRAFRRPPTNTEIDRFVKAFAVIRPSVDTFEAAARETLSLVLIAPQFLLHATGENDEYRHYEIASRLSYFLWASMPDAQLMSLAAQGQLTDPAVLKAQATRMLADERAQDFVRSFTTQWLSVMKMKTVPINNDLFPRFLYRVARGERAGTEVPYRPTVRDYMIDETVGFVGELIRRNASVLQIVDSDFVYINDRLARHYGIADVEGVHFRAVPVKSEHRLGGLLTQGSMLIGNATGTAPHPIYRAVWLREAILGDIVPPPPADVPALSDTAGESAEKALSIAELLAKHRQVESCNDCHVRLDPWGLPFEQYNAIGLYQPMVPKEGTRIQGFNASQHKTIEGYKDYIAKLNTEPIKAKSRVPQGPEVDGMQALKTFLVTERKKQIVENVMRRLLTYSLGRELTYRDRFAVEALCNQAEKNNFKFREMILSICSSNLLQGLPPEKAH